ncbi:general transcription factor 3C polypeptide 3 [Euwallacea fornicatus]|uniref:general transcription factor 3C polypeptide 3 n=1 Tax=Euwallacea fornicatus TaxID=995702 RepID=UPI00338F0D5E
MEEEVLLLNIPSYDEQEYDDVEERDNMDVDEVDETEKSKEKKIASKLPPSIRGLMGEANLRFARGEVELAKKMCFEVIRQAPEAYEPYLTLAQMYENHNVKKYKGFLMLAAYLHPSDSDIWSRLAEVEILDNQISAAVVCYSKAIRSNPHNIELHIKRINLIKEKLPQRTKQIQLLRLNLAKVLPKSKHSQILAVCTEIAKAHYEAKNYIRAIEALKICLMRIPEHTSQDVLNMMLELLLISERYSECLDIFTQFCGFQFDLSISDDMSIIIHHFIMPENVHLDIKTKFIVCLINLQSYHLIEGLIHSMLEKDDVEVSGAMYFEIAEALMNLHLYKEALALLLPLVKSKNYSLAAIWLKHGETLSKLNMYDQAIDAYQTVISLAPNHVEVLYPLAMLLLKQNRKEEALKVLSQDFSTGKLHVAVLVEQMKLLKQIGDLENYWKCCEMLLSRHCIIFKDYDELRVILNATNRDKWQKLARLRMIKGDVDDLDSVLESIFEPTVDDEYKIFLDILKFAFEQKAYSELQKFSFMGLTSKRFGQYFPEIYVIACYACIFTKDYYHAYLITRHLLIQHPDNYKAWNFFSITANHTQETIKVTRFFESAVAKSRMPVAYTDLLRANHYCSVALFPQCLSYFLNDYKDTQNSYSAFMIGMVMLQQYCQRKPTPINKKTLVEMVTYLFLNYAKIRSKNAQQEVYYNLGRMYQQIGVFHLAEHFYKLVFKVQNRFLQEYPEYLDLRQEAAYNLHLIYKNSGNLDAARAVLWKYVVI